MRHGLHNCSSLIIRQVEAAAAALRPWLPTGARVHFCGPLEQYDPAQVSRMLASLLERADRSMTVSLGTCQEAGVCESKPAECGFPPGVTHAVISRMETAFRPFQDPPLHRWDWIRVTVVDTSSNKVVARLRAAWGYCYEGSGEDWSCAGAGHM